jgi:hypothetical protein
MEHTMNLALPKVLLATLISLSLALMPACGDDGSGSTDTCTPDEPFAAGDGCNTCQCPESGLMSEASCTTVSCEPASYNGCEDLPCGAWNCNLCDPEDPDCVPTLATTYCNAEGMCVTGTPGPTECEPADLCADVTCPTTPPSCEGDVAQNGSSSECVDGECIPAPGLPPEDCSAQGLVCEQGACVEGAEPCGDLFCEDVPDSCNGTMVNPGWSRECDVATGACLDGAAEQPFDCADNGMICVDGDCVMESGDLCAGVNCTVPDTAVCDGDVAVTTNGEGDCDSNSGTCYWDPMQTEDCPAQGLTCEGGACVGESCEPGESYYFVDDKGCHSCNCPLSGIKSDDNCSLTTDLTLCGEEDLCPGVVCSPTLPFCDGQTAHVGLPTACAPGTGLCEPTALPTPKDCSDTGENCFEGECVPDDTDLCDLAECDGSPAFCSGDLAVGPTSEWCDPATGECVLLPGVFTQDCAAINLTCEDGQCI